MTGAVAFGERVRDALDRFGPLCVGVDPHGALLESWGLDASADGAREFGLRVVDAAAGRVGIVKPQVSFFERYGSAGFAALEEVMATARAAGLLVIADAKRGDIGSTMDAYGEAWLTPGSPLEADAMTANPFLGVRTLDGHARAGRSVRQRRVRARRNEQPRCLHCSARDTRNGCDGLGEPRSPRSRSATPASHATASGRAPAS